MGSEKKRLSSAYYGGCGMPIVDRIEGRLNNVTHGCPLLDTRERTKKFTLQAY